MSDIKKKIERLIMGEYDSQSVHRLLVRGSYHYSFDYAIRMLLMEKSTSKKSLIDEKCLVYDMPNVCREQIIEKHHPDSILAEIRAVASVFHAPIVTMVSHGTMAAVMAETIYNDMTGKTITLADALPGNGYCVIQRTAKVIDISQGFCEIPCD